METVDMSNRGNTDPEVEADQRLALKSLRDSSRTPKAPDPDIVDRWPCRNANCPEGRPLLGVTLAAVRRFEESNAYLRNRKLPELTTADVMLCASCRRALDEITSVRYAARKEKMAVLIRELSKPFVPAEREREIIDQLKRWDHPDVQGLCQAIAERRSHRRGAKDV